MYKGFCASFIKKNWRGPRASEKISSYCEREPRVYGKTISLQWNSKYEQ